MLDEHETNYLWGKILLNRGEKESSQWSLKIIAPSAVKYIYLQFFLFLVFPLAILLLAQTLVLSILFVLTVLSVTQTYRT